MQEKTRLYFKNLIANIDIELNTIDFALQDIKKDLRKMKKFYTKIITKT